MKNKLMRAATLLMVLTLMTSCFVGSTFAKYTSTATGSDTATVAQWSILVKGENDVDGKQIAVSPETTVSFNLFDTVNDTVNSADETDVAGLLIAPGTEGSFNFTITNESEVNAKYAVTLVEEKTIAPLQFKLDTGEWEEEISALNLTEKAIAMTNGEATHTIYWRWQFEEGANAAEIATNNTADTALGIAARTGTEEVKINMTITVEQVD